MEGKGSNEADSKYPRLSIAEYSWDASFQDSTPVLIEEKAKIREIDKLPNGDYIFSLYPIKNNIADISEQNSLFDWIFSIECPESFLHVILGTRVSVLGFAIELEGDRKGFYVGWEFEEDLPDEILWSFAPASFNSIVDIETVNEYLSRNK